MKYPAPSWINNHSKVTLDVNTEFKKQPQRTKNYISKKPQQEKQIYYKIWNYWLDNRVQIKDREYIKPWQFWICAVLNIKSLWCFIWYSQNIKSYLSSLLEIVNSLFSHSICQNFWFWKFHWFAKEYFSHRYYFSSVYS